MSYFIVRMWGKKNYPDAKEFSGQVQDIKTGKAKWFHSAGELLNYLEKNIK